MEQNRLKKFIVNGLSLTATALVMRTVSVAFNAYLTAAVGAEGIGLVTLAMSIYGFAVTFATSGVNLASTRLIAEAMGREDERAAGRSLRLCLGYAFGFGALASVLLFASSDWIGGTLLADVRTVPSLRVLSLSLIPIALSSAINGYFTATRRVMKNAAAQLLEQAVKIFLTSYVLLSFLPRGLTYACLAIVGGGAAAEFVSFFFLFSLFLWDKYQARKAGKKKGNTVPLSMRHVAEISLPVAAGAYARSALVTAEHIAIPRALGMYGSSKTEALASYGVLHSMTIPILLYPMALLTACAGLLVPEFAESMAKRDGRRMRSMAERSVRYTLRFAIGVAGGMLLLSGLLGTVIYRSTEAGKYLAMLAPILPIMYLDHVVDGILKGIGRQVYSMIVNISDSVLSIVLVFLFLPKMGAVGYVYVIAIAELFNFILSFYGLISALPFRFGIFENILLPMGSVMLSMGILHCILPPMGGAPALICAGILYLILYAALLWILEKTPLLWKKGKKKEKIFLQ